MIIKFTQRTRISFYNEDSSFRKKDIYETDILAGEQIYFFKDIVKASDRSLFLTCTDNTFAKIDINAIGAIIL